MKLSTIFTDNMVLQAKRPIRIFGEGTGVCSISFEGKTKTIVSNSDKWLIEFEEMEYGGPYNMEIIINDKKTVIKNIMIGEVILCAGQSNIAFTVEEDQDQTDIKSNHLIRTFVSSRPEKSVGLKTENGWVEAELANIPFWSAIGYFVASKLSNSGISVGIIGCYQGASVIQSWLPDESISKKEFFIPKEELKGNHINEFSVFNKPGFLYNCTVKPILPFSVGNVIWYQGESNAASLADSTMYEKMLKELICVWRNNFKYLELPFIIVQIHDYDDRNDECWKMIQQTQEFVCKETSCTKLVKSNQFCETSVIHPTKKKALSLCIADNLILYK